MAGLRLVLVVLFRHHPRTQLGLIKIIVVNVNVVIIVIVIIIFIFIFCIISVIIINQQLVLSAGNNDQVLECVNQG